MVFGPSFGASNKMASGRGPQLNPNQIRLGTLVSNAYISIKNKCALSLTLPIRSILERRRTEKKEFQGFTYALVCSLTRTQPSGFPEGRVEKNGCTKYFLEDRYSLEDPPGKLSFKNSLIVHCRPLVVFTVQKINGKDQSCHQREENSI